MNLSPHFSYEEMTRTDTVFSNIPDMDQYENLKLTAEHMEAVRCILLNRPIIIRSAFRSPQVNEAVRGVSTSAHCNGYAVDFTCPDFGLPYAICWSLKQYKFDQLIQEGHWVHISFDPLMRGEVLTAKVADNGKATYTKGLV